MKKTLIVLAIITLTFVLSCKKKEIDPEPGYVLQKWAVSLSKFDYNNYSKCEAYPKDEPVFRKIYKDDYFTDIMVVKAGDPDKKRIQKDYKGNSYISRDVSFEGNIVKRLTGKPYQLMSGEIKFIKFLDGTRSRDGWLISNRTITRTNK